MKLGDTGYTQNFLTLVHTLAGKRGILTDVPSRPQQISVRIWSCFDAHEFTILRPHLSINDLKQLVRGKERVTRMN